VSDRSEPNLWPKLRSARPDDWSRIATLLSDSGLPVADLGADALDDFLVAENGSQLMGLIGLQRYNKVGLLRSLVVGGDARGSGIGARLVGALESAALTSGIAELWLLTIDAEKFFQKHGFDIVDRSTAPECIRATAEFSDLCPGDAYLMKKDIRK